MKCRECSADAGDQTRCKRHAAMAVERQRRLKERRRAANRCWDCGAPVAKTVEVEHQKRGGEAGERTRRTVRRQATRCNACLARQRATVAVAP
jgi:ribosomal protein S14